MVLSNQVFRNCKTAEDVLAVKSNCDKYKMLEAVVKEYCGDVEIEVTPDESACFPLGYIDHQSDSVAHEAFGSENEMANFLFNPQSELQTSNDNC